MAEAFKVITCDYVDIHLTSSGDDKLYLPKRFFKALTIADLKSKLEMLTGGSSATMRLQLFDKDLICELDNDDALLGSYPIESGMRIHVIDNFNFQALDTDKFEISSESYEKRPYTVRNFLLQNKLGKYNEEEMQRFQENKLAKEQEEAARAEKINVGDRCLVRVTGQPARKGCVRFKGEVEGLNDILIGVQYDEPVGKNDGTFKDKRYFTCPPKYGGFVKVIAVEVGEFPEDEVNFEDEI